jgi:hypothetical protein
MMCLHKQAIALWRAAGQHRHLITGHNPMTRKLWHRWYSWRANTHPMTAEMALRLGGGCGGIFGSDDLLLATAADR